MPALWLLTLRYRAVPGVERSHQIIRQDREGAAVTLTMASVGVVV